MPFRLEYCIPFLNIVEFVNYSWLLRVLVINFIEMRPCCYFLSELNYKEMIVDISFTGLLYFIYIRSERTMIISEISRA